MCACQLHLVVSRSVLNKLSVVGQTASIRPRPVFVFYLVVVDDSLRKIADQHWNDLDTVSTAILLNSIDKEDTGFYYIIDIGYSYCPPEKIDFYVHFS